MAARDEPVWGDARRLAAVVEEWRAIPGWPYEASSLGRIRHAASRRIRRLWLLDRPPSPPYLIVNLYDRPRRIHCLVSRLVCLAFHGEPPGPGYQAAHLDGCSLVNVPGNLAWQSRSENNLSGYGFGRRRRLILAPRARP